MWSARQTKFEAGAGAHNVANTAHNRRCLPGKAPHPELAALVRHGGRRSFGARYGERGALEQASHQKQRDDCDSEAQVGKANCGSSETVRRQDRQK